MNTTIRISGEFLRVTTPLRCTSSGNCGVAIATRFCTKTCALSRSVPSLKVMVIVSWPFEVAWLYMYSMSSTPLICCSIGAATVSEMVCAEAPGYFRSEGDGDRELAVRGRLAVHVQHVLDAVDLLLDRSSHGVGNGLRRGARILRGHHHGRRHHLRIFGDRQRGIGDRADDQQHDGQ